MVLGPYSSYLTIFLAQHPGMPSLWCWVPTHPKWPSSGPNILVWQFHGAGYLLTLYDHPLGPTSQCTSFIVHGLYLINFWAQHPGVPASWCWVPDLSSYQHLAHFLPIFWPIFWPPKYSRFSCVPGGLKWVFWTSCATVWGGSPGLHSRGYC